LGIGDHQQLTGRYPAPERRDRRGERPGDTICLCRWPPDVRNRGPSRKKSLAGLIAATMIRITTPSRRLLCLQIAHAWREATSVFESGPPMTGFHRTADILGEVVALPLVTPKGDSTQRPRLMSSSLLAGQPWRISYPTNNLSTNGVIAPGNRSCG
jgi:hypothetical protein